MFTIQVQSSVLEDIFFQHQTVDANGGYENTLFAHIPHSIELVESSIDTEEEEINLDLTITELYAFVQLRILLESYCIDVNQEAEAFYKTAKRYIDSYKATRSFINNKNGVTS